eukprot:m.8674 g.8674  ORF g.8674 m.8674 type:complete len:1489 (+) comp20758_c0_seq2:87-4553(+)
MVTTLARRPLQRLTENHRETVDSLMTVGDAKGANCVKLSQRKGEPRKGGEEPCSNWRTKCGREEAATLNQGRRGIGERDGGGGTISSEEECDGNRAREKQRMRMRRKPRARGAGGAGGGGVLRRFNEIQYDDSSSDKEGEEETTGTLGKEEDCRRRLCQITSFFEVEVRDRAEPESGVAKQNDDRVAAEKRSRPFSATESDSSVDDSRSKMITDFFLPVRSGGKNPGVLPEKNVMSSSLENAASSSSSSNDDALPERSSPNFFVLSTTQESSQEVGMSVSEEFDGMEDKELPEFAELSSFPTFEEDRKRRRRRQQSDCDSSGLEILELSEERESRSGVSSRRGRYMPLSMSNGHANHEASEDVFRRLRTAQRKAYEKGGKYSLTLDIDIIVQTLGSDPGSNTTTTDKESDDEDYRKIIEWENLALNCAPPLWQPSSPTQGCEWREPSSIPAICKDNIDFDLNARTTGDSLPEPPPNEKEACACEEVVQAIAGLKCAERQTRKKKKKRPVLSVKSDSASVEDVTQCLFPCLPKASVDSDSEKENSSTVSADGDVFDNAHQLGKRKREGRRPRRRTKPLLLFPKADSNEEGEEREHGQASTETSQSCEDSDLGGQRRRQPKRSRLSLSKPAVVVQCETKEEVISSQRQPPPRGKSRKGRRRIVVKQEEPPEQETGRKDVNLPTTLHKGDFTSSLRKSNDQKGKPKKFCSIFCDQKKKEGKEEAASTQASCQLSNALDLVALMPESELRKKSRMESVNLLPDSVPFPAVSHVLQLEDNVALKNGDCVCPFGFKKDNGAGSEFKGRHLTPNEFTIPGKSSVSRRHHRPPRPSCDETTSVRAVLKRVSENHPSVDIKEMYDMVLKRVAKMSADLPWANVFAPDDSKELVVNADAIHQLRTWLMAWQRLPAASDPSSAAAAQVRVEEDQLRRKRKRVTNHVAFEDDEDFVVTKNRYVWCADSDGDDDEETERSRPRKAVVLLGPHGSGKTSGLYACAKELGLQVLELNESSKRTGKQLQLQLHEATLSHGVSRPALNRARAKTEAKPAVHPAFSAFLKKGSLHQKGNELVEIQRKTSKHKQRKKRGQVLDLNSSSEEEEANDVQVVAVKMAAPTPSPVVVLIDDVEVVFEEDTGFWAAVGNIIETTKRPLVLATSDELVLANCNFQHEVIKFSSPLQEKKRLVAFLQLVCLSKRLAVSQQLVESVVWMCKGDIRRCLNCLQFWCSGGQESANIKQLTESANFPLLLKHSSASTLSLGEGNGLSQAIVAGIQRKGVAFSGMGYLLPFLLKAEVKDGGESVKEKREREEVQLAMLNKYSDILSLSDILSSSHDRSCVSGLWRNCWEHSPLGDEQCNDDILSDLLLPDGDGDGLCPTLEAACLSHVHSLFKGRYSSSYHCEDARVLDLISTIKEGDNQREKTAKLGRDLAASFPINNRCSRGMMAKEVVPVVRLICKVEEEKAKSCRKRRGFVHRFNEWMGRSLCCDLANTFPVDSC